LKIMGGLLVIVAFFALRPVLSDMFSAGVTKAVSRNPATCMKMLGSTTNEQDGGTYIVGSVRNDCDSTVGSVTVTFKIQMGYGKDSPWHEGVGYAYVRNIKAGETQRFKSAVPVGKNAIIRFDKIVAF